MFCAEGKIVYQHFEIIIEGKSFSVVLLNGKEIFRSENSFDKFETWAELEAITRRF